MACTSILFDGVCSPWLFGYGNLHNFTICIKYYVKLLKYQYIIMTIIFNIITYGGKGGSCVRDILNNN
jgi:hypothetical protein